MIYVILLNYIDVNLQKIISISGKGIKPNWQSIVDWDCILADSWANRSIEWTANGAFGWTFPLTFIKGLYITMKSLLGHKISLNSTDIILQDW